MAITAAAGTPETSPSWAQQPRTTASKLFTQNFQTALFSSLLEATTGELKSLLG
jgi:hypothetical protein